MLSSGLIQPVQKPTSPAIFATSFSEPVDGDWQAANGKSLAHKNDCFVLTVFVFPALI
jgi:hypothetical protein